MEADAAERRPPGKMPCVECHEDATQRMTVSSADRTMHTHHSMSIKSRPPLCFLVPKGPHMTLGMSQHTEEDSIATLIVTDSFTLMRNVIYNDCVKMSTLSVF